MPEKQKKRIWELDFIRGFCILLMIMDHAFYDLAYLFGQKWALAFFNWPVRSIGWWIAVFCFVTISGISSTLSRSNSVRGLQLAAVALVLSLATGLMDRLAGQTDGFIVRFGILHMLAACMLIYAVMKNKSIGFRAAISFCAIAAGIYFVNYPLNVGALSESAPFLKVLGALVKSRGAFYSADYFPLLPWLGFFIFGSILGQILYGKKVSLNPLERQRAVVDTICFIGRYSLVFYVLHQPLIYGALKIIFSPHL